MKLDREKNLELARNCAAQVVRDYKPGFALAEDIMMQMAKVAMDALDCDMRRQPFHSATLSKLSYHARDFISTDKESTLAKVAYAFAIIMGELNGSIIGTARTTTSIKDVSATALPINICDKDVKLEPLDDEEMAVKEEVIEDMMEPTANYSQLFSHDGLEEVKKEDLEDPIMYSDDQPSSSFALPQAPIVDQPCSSKSKTVARSQYAQGEVHARIGTHRKRPRGDDQLAVRACNPRGIVDPTPPKPRANGGECKYCNVPVRLGEFDNHMRNCHGEIFLQDISRCPIKECDFRSMVPETRRQHAIFHTRNNSWDYYAIDINTTCPYCPETVTTIGDYTMHMSNCHRTMTINRVQIHGCGCGLKTARVHQMIEHWDVLRSCERRLFFNYGVARAALQHVNALKQQRPREMRLVAISQGCRRLQTTSSQLKDNHWRCRICLLPLRKPEVDAHMQLEHRDVWLKEEHKCFVKECDFRSTIPETLQHHQMTFVTHNGSSIGNIYSIGLGATCPYCPLMLTNIGDYVRHLNESHKSMMASLARVNVCACCGYASSRVFQMIIHWNARKTACKCTMRFDYAVAKAALEKSQKEDARISEKVKTESAPSR